ncbi:MAG: hypothetical protein AMS20_01475 [Gemmatimonas sp. SG8_28]|nr:MAG: hypothetical protein AMS20_01475 [Gemmatimonas sp. SG8_28]
MSSRVLHVRIAAAAVIVAAFPMLSTHASAQSRWSVAAAGGYQLELSEGYPSGGIVGTVGIGYRLGRVVSLGLEGGYHHFGTDSLAPDAQRTLSLWQASAVARFALGSDRVAPYALIGIGPYWQIDKRPAENLTDIAAGGTAALGILFHPGTGAGIALTLEARTHIVAVTGTDLAHWETRPLMGVMAGVRIPIGG